MTNSNTHQSPAARSGKRWFSKTGLGLCLAYLYVCITCIQLAGGLQATTQSQRSLLWFPLTPQVWLLDHGGLGRLLERATWLEAYLRIGGMTLPVLYGIGYAVERLVASVRHA